MEPYLAEIRATGFNFAPRGWALCNGQLLPIAQNQSLFSLLGTMYGGDGRTTFGLPDLRGRTPIHVSDTHPQGQHSGMETVTLSASELPEHGHNLKGSADAGAQPVPTGNALASAMNVYHTASGTTTTLNPVSVGSVGGGQAHNNMQPFLTVNYIIAVQGLFPSRN